MLPKDDSDGTDVELTAAHQSIDPERTRTRDAGSDPFAAIQVPGYEIGSEIARGGMGVVLAARDLALHREVAIKTLLPGSLENLAAIRRFVREARISARLPHPGIPPIYALGELPDSRPYLAMKLIKGRTLAGILAAREQRPSSESCDDLDLTSPDAPGLVQVFGQVCQAVGFAHSQGVVHRDLKPANVMVGAFGEVQVMDWGLARAGEEIPESLGGGDTRVHEPLDLDLSRIGEAMGTPAYMPPEQARGEWHRVDARADVFSLGGILSAILTGKPPYTGANVFEVVKRAQVADLAEAFERLDLSAADTDLIQLAKWCMAEQPVDRPPDAGAVAALTEAYRLGVEERLRTAERQRVALAAKAKEARKRAAMESHVRQSLEARSAEERRRIRRQTKLAAAMILLAFAGIGVAWWKDHRDLEARTKATECATCPK